MLRFILLAALFFLSGAANAKQDVTKQRVWLDYSASLFDPNILEHRKVIYVDLPLPKKGNYYQLSMFYANGQPALEGISLDEMWAHEVLLGHFTRYYENGNTWQSGNLIPRSQVCNCNDATLINQGEFSYYHKNGQLQKSVTYADNNIVDGQYDEFDEQGRTTKSYTIKNNQYHNIYQEFHNGELLLLKTYQTGKLDGLQETYDKSGNIKTRQHYLSNHA